MRDTIHASYIRNLSFRSGTPMWPKYTDQVEQKMSYPVDHHRLNAFYQSYGYLPSLEIPKGYHSWVKNYLSSHFEGRRIVVINPRQSRLTHSPTVIYRDADLADWHEFINYTGKKMPEVLFCQVGAFSEWDSKLSTFPNVFIPRLHGLSLAHELALLQASDMFIGTSSGFATMATFSRFRI